MPLRIGRRKLLAGVAGMVVVAISVIAWYVGGVDWLLWVVLATVVAGVATLGYMVAQSERRLGGETREAAAAAASSTNALGERLDELSRATRELKGRVERPGEQAEALLRAVQASHKRLELEQERRLDQHRSDVEALIDQRVRQIVELLQSEQRAKRDS